MKRNGSQYLTLEGNGSHLKNTMFRSREIYKDRKPKENESGSDEVSYTYHCEVGNTIISGTLSAIKKSLGELLDTDLTGDNIELYNGESIICARFIQTEENPDKTVRHVYAIDSMSQRDVIKSQTEDTRGALTLFLLNPSEQDYPKQSEAPTRKPSTGWEPRPNTQSNDKNSNWPILKTVSNRS